jgi:HTH-type transcriptional regulator/antitoxin HigA
MTGSTGAVSTKHVYQVINGAAPVSSELAIALERVTGVAAGLWNGLEANYRDFLAREAEEDELHDQVGWLTELPIRAMVKRGLIVDHGRDNVAQLRSVLEYFGVANRSSFNAICDQAQFRKAKAFVSNPADVAVWLRAGELAAASITTDPFDARRFRGELDAIRSLTVARNPADFLDDLVARCRRSGVAVVVVPEIGKTRLCGAARWLGPHRALIQLSGRGKWAEAFWFTFFHEAAHVLLHPKKRTFVDDGLAAGDRGGTTATDDGEDDRFEQQADRFAHDQLIPVQYGARLATIRTTADLRGFAAEIGVGTAIVAGRLHKTGLIPSKRFNKADVHPRYHFDEGAS